MNDRYTILTTEQALKLAGNPLVDFQPSYFATEFDSNRTRYEYYYIFDWYRVAVYEYCSGPLLQRKDLNNEQTT